MGLSCFKSWKHDRAGLKGNRDVLASPGSYFFLSNSAGQGDEWLKSLNRGVWIPFTGVFGQRLEETVLYERRYGVCSVPLVVEQCVAFIRERGLQEVGLFRQPGRASSVRELQEAFDAGERPSFDSNTDVHTVASLLKLYLRQLPEPLVPFGHYRDFLLSGQKLSSDRAQGLEELRSLLQELPVANFNLLHFICQFLNEVQSHSKGNKMSCQNLATVFGPNILRAKAEDPQSIVGGAALVQVLMSELIREHQSLFSRVSLAAPAQTARGFHASPGPLRRAHLHQAPCLRQMSLPLIAEPCRESGESSSSIPLSSEVTSNRESFLGHRYTSSHPENCFFPLSSHLLQNHTEERTRDQQQHLTSCPSSPANVRSDAKPTFAPMDRMEVWTALGEAAGDTAAAGGGYLWSSSATQMAVAKVEGAQVASGDSSEAQEDSTPSHYDNLDRASSSQTLDDIADSDHNGRRLNTPTSGSILSPISTGSSEVFLPSAPPDDAQSLLGKLRQQMAQQTYEYQSRIHRLERCNDALERQVAALRDRLEQQRRSRSAAEVRIGQVERARAAADHRNATLQADMELFFRTRGKIRTRERGDEGKRDRRILKSL
ncbi:rho GTPase-activating protein 24-like [Syngnathus typhle]